MEFMTKKQNTSIRFYSMPSHYKTDSKHILNIYLYNIEYIIKHVSRFTIVITTREQTILIQSSHSLLNNWVQELLKGYIIRFPVSASDGVPISYLSQQQQQKQKTMDKTNRQLTRKRLHCNIHETLKAPLDAF